MRMFHPDLEYTKFEGHPTTKEAFELAWKPKGWQVWPPKLEFALVDEEE